MRKIEISDLKNLHEYELIRDDWRREVIAVKARRRVLVGPTMSFAFENRLTVLNQIQEMCRAERIVHPDRVKEEVEVYNDLLPGDGEVAATLFIEIQKEPEIQPELDRLIGLANGKCLWLEIDGRRAYATFDGGQHRDDRISAVQYLVFPVAKTDAERASFEAAKSVKLVVEHPAYHEEVELSKDTREELLRDLAS